MDYQVNFGFHAFSVPSAVVDNLIRLAKEEHLKVLLYLLRYPDKQFTASQIATFLRLPEEQVEEALAFWLQVNILEEKFEGRQLELFPSPIPTPSPPPPPVYAPEPPEPESKPAPEKLQISDPFKFFTPESISESIDSSLELRKLIRLAEEKYYRRLLNTSQTKSLVWMYEYLGMSVEMILILLQYCSDTDNMRQQYIDKIAVNWYEDDILTAEAAEKRVHELMEFYTYTNYICRIFELNATSKAQKEYIEIWQTMNFTEELLQYARDLSVEATGKVNFKYIHSILNEWHENQITDIQEAEKNHDAYIKQYIEKKKKGRKKKNDDISEEKKKELDEYLSLVNVFEEDTNQ